MTKLANNQKVEIDIHNMNRDQAKKHLEQFLNKADKSITEVTVIHGYNEGQALLNMVQKGLKHKRIKSKIKSLNQGITILILN